MLRPNRDGHNKTSPLPNNPWDDPNFDASVRDGSNSRFQDSIWEQPVYVLTQTRSRVRINFDIDLGTGERLTDPHLSDLLWACKCYIWSQIHASNRGKGAPATVRRHWMNLSFLVKWMRAYSYDAFVDMDQEAIRDYTHYVRQSAASSHTRARYLQILRDIYFHKDQLPEGFRLLSHPFGGEADPERFNKTSLRSGNSIPFIPDEVIIPTLIEARRWLEQYAADVVRLTEQAEACGATPGTVGYDQNRKKRVAVIRSFVPSAGVPGDWHVNPITHVKDLYALQKRVHAAAIIVIGCFAGLRLHEILTLEPGCIRGPVPSEDGTLELFYVRGSTVKVSPHSSGHAREWVAGARPVGTTEKLAIVEAVRVLEAIHRASPIRYAKLLFSPRDNVGYTVITLQQLLQDFFTLTTPSTKRWRVTSHQLRKTFARFVSRYDTKNNAALSQQLGHVRLAMTDAYAAKDLDLIQLLKRENTEIVGEGFMALLRAGEMAGKKGEEIVLSIARLRAKIADEGEFISICSRLGRDADIVLHLGEHGACYFRQSTAACGGATGPNLAVRTPTMCLGCENLVVTEEHRLFWERRVRDNERLLKDYPDAWPTLIEKWTKNLAQAKQLLAKLTTSREILHK